MCLSVEEIKKMLEDDSITNILPYINTSKSVKCTETQSGQPKTRKDKIHEYDILLEEYENKRKIKKNKIDNDKLKAFKRESLKEDKGSSCEKIIRVILQDKGISFKEQYTFSDLKYKNSLRIDFMLLYRKRPIVAIEYNGEQHYNYIKGLHSSIDDFEESKVRDEIKSQYLKKKKIELIVIPYTENNKILNYIELAISKYKYEVLRMNSK